MAETRWDQRFLSSTRGRIVLLLRRASRTVDELAQMLGLTDNAVRSHLISLERDGLVEQSGVRRGIGKPAYAYDLTPEAEQLFPKAYAPVLGELLAVLDERLGPEAMVEVLQSVGRRLVSGQEIPEGLEARLETAVTVLNRLGGLAEAEIDGQTVRIRGYGCPLSAVSGRHCEICRLGAALASQIVGLPMEPRCDYEPRPRCLFEGTLASA